MIFYESGFFSHSIYLILHIKYIIISNPVDSSINKETEYFKKLLQRVSLTNTNLLKTLLPSVTSIVLFFTFNGFSLTFLFYLVVNRLLLINNLHFSSKFCLCCLNLFICRLFTFATPKPQL